MFVQGTRDPLCPLDLLEDVRKRMRASSSLHVVDDADHSLLVSKSGLKARGATQEQADEEWLKAVDAFLAESRHSGGRAANL